LSREKREGTIGLLFLTDLRGYDVVFGKLAGTSLNSVYSLLAIFPPLAVSLTLGGVTGGEFWRLTLLLVNTLFLSLSVGMCVSAVSLSERKAWLATLGLLAGITGVPLLLPDWLLGPAAKLFYFSPVLAFKGMFDLSYQMDASRYWSSLAGSHALGWILMGMATTTPAASTPGVCG
jgi:hypothetical protein